MKNKQIEITQDKYNRILTDILEDDDLQVHEKVIKMLDKCGKYKIVKNTKKKS